MLGISPHFGRTGAIKASDQKLLPKREGWCTKSRRIGATFLDRSEEEEEEEKDEVERWDERIAVASKLGVGQRVKERERESEKRRNDGGRWTVR